MMMEDGVFSVIAEETNAYAALSLCVSNNKKYHEGKTGANYRCDHFQHRN